MKKTSNWNHEWYLYSAVTIVGSLTFLVFQFSSGPSQTIGIAFSALVGTFLFASKSWKDLPDEVHQWCIFFSILVTLISGLIFYLLGSKKTIK